MEQRLANTWRMTVNENKFIEMALLSDLRIDGRGPFDYRNLTIQFGRLVVKTDWFWSSICVVDQSHICFTFSVFLSICFKHCPPTKGPQGSLLKRCFVRCPNCCDVLVLGQNIGDEDNLVVIADAIEYFAAAGA